MCLKRSRAIGPAVGGSVNDFGISGKVRFNIGELDENIRVTTDVYAIYNITSKQLIPSTSQGLFFLLKETSADDVWPYFGASLNLLAEQKSIKSGVLFSGGYEMLYRQNYILFAEGSLGFGKLPFLSASAGMLFKF